MQIKSYLKNTFYVIKSMENLIVLSAVLLTYLVYYTAEKEHDRLQRKQPGQFDHEK